MAIKADVDHRDCENAMSDERLSIAIIEPIHYKLFLKLNMESENYDGESDIVIKIHKPTKRLSLHCFGSYIDTSSILLKSITEALNPNTRYASYRVCTKIQRFDILYDDLISPGLYELHIHFYGIYNKNENIIRYQYMRYTETEATRRWFLGILSTSNRARTLFPCWDEPEIHMNYEIIIEHPEQYKVISNMPVQQLINKSDDTSLTYFHTSKPIASSQVAIIMVDNMTHSNLGDDLYWYQRDIVKNTNITLEILKTKELFKNYLGVHYRCIETDHIVIPYFPSQIRGSLGVIIYREESFKYDNATDFPGRKMYIYKYERDSSIMDLSIVQTMQGALYYDVDFQMAPVSQNKFVHPIDEIDAIYYSRPYYNKGAAIMRMLFYSLEAPEYVYKEIIRKLAKKCDNTTDSMSGLWAIVQSSLTNNDKLLYNITEIMDTWMTKRHFPELKVDCDYNGILSRQLR
ncbi:glutamyl aminopeptidase-like [Odontomachus brunneus]|uniref:glutamyl aminopeptidase-like n=1 Tax=Odontomachus brunneus TaxID=486640 RepID=UPI0013F26D17|nr:glutamyl aminopeptidase-like [Odontomachus brunneus]